MSSNTGRDNMSSTPIIRSVLFVPGNQPRLINKAMATAADRVIIDLEDAVPADEKQATRRVVNEALLQNPDRSLWVRVNGPDTKWIHDDLAAVMVSGIGGIMVPKLETPSQVAAVCRWISKNTKPQEIDIEKLFFIPLIETALSVENAYGIAIESVKYGKNAQLAFGAADFTTDMGINLTNTGDELMYPRARIAVASRAAGVRAPMDTPYMVDIRDTENLRADAKRARTLGFQGKLCVHPSQVDVVNNVFSPKQSEIEFAGRVIAAYDTAIREGKGAVQLDGKFVDAPVVERARQIVDWKND